jgi:hypothetical protein
LRAAIGVTPDLSKFRIAYGRRRDFWAENKGFAFPQSSWGFLQYGDEYADRLPV